MRELAARLARYGDVSTALGVLSDHQLGRLVDEARALGAGVGGASALLDVAGAPVFVKRIPLTDLEREPGNVRSTGNVFGLPVFCQYSVVRHAAGGFGAWRELAANTMTTNWVLAQRTEAFPLMYHWRVLPGAMPLPDELADIERVVAYWDGSAAVRRRLHALDRASVSVVLFLEHVPHTLNAWLASQLAAGPDAVAAACAMVERRLRTDIAFMNANGLLHLDTHFGNILTDGHRLYLADLGLATSPLFDLSAGEREFLARTASHDAAYAARELHNWMVANAAPGPVAELVGRYAPVAALVNDFYRDVFGASRATPYPAREIEQALAAIAAPARRMG